MASIRPGDKPVLIIVDVQDSVVKDAWDAPRIVGNVALTVSRARARGVPVIWVQHSDDELVQGSAGWQWAPGLAPADGDVRIDKHFNSSFEATTLDSELARLGATHITLAGAATNWCIRATAYGALERGYDLTLVRDAHTTRDTDLGDGTAIAAAHMVKDLNIAITWLSYPGRSNGTAAAADVEFTRPVTPAA